MRFIALVVLSLASSQAQSECPVLSFPQTIQQAETAIIDDELNQARKLIDEAIDWLPCARKPLDSTLVSGLWQIAAAAAFYGGDEQAARVHLARAKSIPGALFRERLGSDLHSLWQRENPLLNATLSVSPLPPPHLLMVDGVVRGQSVLALTAGPHWVQVLNGQEVIFQRAIRINSDVRAEINTGLPVTLAVRAKDERRGSPLIWGSVVSGVASLGFYGMAVQKDAQMKIAKTPNDVRNLRKESLGLRNAAVGAGLLSATSLSMHFFF
jgi:hypothetical protein